MSSQPKQSWGGKFSFSLLSRMKCSGSEEGRPSFLPQMLDSVTPGTTFPASTCLLLNTCFYPPRSKPPFLLHLSSGLSPSLHVLHDSQKAIRVFCKSISQCYLHVNSPSQIFTIFPGEETSSQAKDDSAFVITITPPPNVTLQKHADLSNGPNSCLLHSPT